MENQFLLLAAISVLSALLTVLIGQVSGMRGDMQKFMIKQTEMNDRLIRLETEHSSAVCQFQKGA